MGLTYHFIDEDCVHGKITIWHGSTRSALLAKQVPEMWGDLNVKYVAANNAAEMGYMGRYLTRARLLTVTILMDYQPVASRWVVVWHIACINFLQSLLSTQSLMSSCAVGQTTLLWAGPTLIN